MRHEIEIPSFFPFASRFEACCLLLCCECWLQAHCCSARLGVIVSEGFFFPKPDFIKQHVVGQVCSPSHWPIKYTHSFCFFLFSFLSFFSLLWFHSTNATPSRDLPHTYGSNPELANVQISRFRSTVELLLWFCLTFFFFFLIARYYITGCFVGTFTCLLMFDIRYIKDVDLQHTAERPTCAVFC